MKKKDVEINEIALSFESSKKDLYEKSNKRAWLVASIAVFLSCLLVVAIILLVPLKTVVPFVVKEDSNGMLQVINKINEENITTSEATDKFWINLYVQKREGYYYNILQYDYEYVQLLSVSNVSADYLEMFTGDNARDKLFQDKKEIKINTKSVVLAESAGSKIATIRIELIQKNMTNNTIESRTTKVVTLNYKYFPAIEQKEENRLLNPLGFKVLTYRQDEEVN